MPGGLHRRLAMTCAIAVVAAGTIVPAAQPAAAQWSTAYEQTYLPASHNWAFRRHFNAAERLFYAFDYGHAILYETLWTRPEAPTSLLEDRIYDRLTRRVLVRPPHVPLEEAAIEVEYAKLVPEAKLMFDWAHVLHRQVYDVWADDRIPPEEKDAHIDEILRYYRSRPDIAFSTRPKSMELMDGQYYSLAFRERFPKFNGLIWAYHWLQVGLYEPLIAGRNSDERQALVRATVARFWQMLDHPPETMPYLMPMTAAVAPVFAERYPEIAIVFDNLHMMHDVISDILASPEVPRDRKRAEIVRAVELFRDDTSYVTTVDEWRRMSIGMGVHNQGGPAIGFMSELPTPTVPRGMSMAGMDHAEMDHAEMDHAAHGRPPAHPPHHDLPGRAMPGREDHAMPGMQHDRISLRQVTELLDRMIADDTIRQRVEADSTLRRLTNEIRETARTGRDAEGGREMDGHQTMEFIVRLLADPQVDARIHADPELHRLWADPAVQHHLRMMRGIHAPGGAEHEGHEGQADPQPHDHHQHQQPRDPLHGH
jgi:hypothetical protein